MRVAGLALLLASPAAGWTALAATSSARPQLTLSSSQCRHTSARVPSSSSVRMSLLPALLLPQPLRLLPGAAQTRRLVTIAIALSCFFTSILHRRSVRRRQQLDPTSEWSRFARYPNARGRALMAGMLRMAPAVGVSVVARDRIRRSAYRTIAAQRLVDELIHLGPTYVKLGQILSCRENSLPKEYISALTRLQDRVPAKCGEYAAQMASTALGAPLDTAFETFDTTPLAAASLGQVHRARLTSAHGGAEVAVKVQREGLRAMYEQDLSLLRKGALLLDRFKVGVGGAEQQWGEVFDEASILLYREIDYYAEANNTERFHEQFADREWVTSPKVYTHLSTETLLVMDYLPGIKISDVAALDARPDVYDRRHLATNLARAYLLQFCTFGFFNTDPHPGNLAVDAGVPGGRLIIYDFGQACELGPRQRKAILAVIESIVNLDAEACVEAFRQMGVLKPNGDMAQVQRVVQGNFDSGRIRSRASRQVDQESDVVTNSEAPSEAEAAKASKEIMGLFQLPAEYAFVARALTQLTGVGKLLDPNFEFIAAVAPAIVEVKGTQAFVKDALSTRWARICAWIRKVLGLPQAVGEENANEVLVG